MKLTIWPLALGLAIAAPLPAADLGVANSYNLFVLGNATRSGSDVEGRVAIGGKATLSSHTIGDRLPNTGEPALVTGGAVSQSGGDIRHGGISAGGSVSLKWMTVAGNVTSGSTVTTNGVTIYGATIQNSTDPLPVDFTQAALDLADASTFWGDQAPTSNVVNNWGTLFFNGSNPDLNVFTVPASTFGNCYGVNINVPAGSTVLINITGASGKMPNTGYNIAGTTVDHVVYNFPQATTLNIGASQGAVFAPRAATSFPYGLAVGTVVVKSLNGSGQINYAPFSGTLPQRGSYGEPN